MRFHPLVIASPWGEIEEDADKAKAVRPYEQPQLSSHFGMDVSPHAAPAPLCALDQPFRFGIAEVHGCVLEHAQMLAEIETCMFRYLSLGIALFFCILSWYDSKS